jgi:ligand-binding SRPBCC domain-containing protein
MTTIELVTLIRAPSSLCFTISLSIDLEVEAAKAYSIRPISGVTSGTIGPGERVQWRTRQFGFWIKHTSEITEYDPPILFEDTMVRGIFSSFRHRHHFYQSGSGDTEMRDELSFSLPLSFLSERLAAPRLRRLLIVRNELIRKTAEEQALVPGR